MFLDCKETPSSYIRPEFDSVPTQKLQEQNKDNREIGFSKNIGPSRSINHKQAFSSILAPITENQFCTRGKILAKLAKDFVDHGCVPPQH
eukprot:9917445-Ditylum_brightwellii.AAC.1